MQVYMSTSLFSNLYPRQISASCGKTKRTSVWSRLIDSNKEVKLSQAVVSQTGLFKAYCVMNAKCHLRNTAARMILFKR